MNLLQGDVWQSIHHVQNPARLTLLNAYLRRQFPCLLSTAQKDLPSAGLWQQQDHLVLIQLQLHRNLFFAQVCLCKRCSPWPGSLLIHVPVKQAINSGINVLAVVEVIFPEVGFPFKIVFLQDLYGAIIRGVDVCFNRMKLHHLKAVF